ncbi:MAG: oligosaccharide flippase family protein [Lachnospiraceae bacterium]|nr:oligosaccharide flippase family protein [Lachnospiraceae bacterium]
MSDESNIKKLFGNSILYIFSGVLAKGIHFFLLPVYTVFLTTSDYGIQNMVISFNSVMTYVVLLCLDSAILKYYSEFKGKKKELKRIYGTAISMVAISSAITLLLFIILKDFLSSQVLKDIDFFPYIILGYFILTFDAFFSLHKRMLEAQQNGSKVALVSVITVLFSTGITLILIGLLKKGAVGLLIAGAIASLGTVIFMIIDIVRNDMVILCLDINMLKKMLRYCIPLIPHHASGYIATFISKIFLNNSNSLAAVGLYGIASQFSNIIDTFQDSASHAYRPWIFVKLQNRAELDVKEIKNSIVLLLTFYTLIYGVVGLFCQEIIYFMTAEQYHGAWKVIPILVIYYSLKSIYYFYVDVCLFYKNTSNKVFIASLLGSLSNIIAAYFLVPVWGMYGSALAMITSICVLTSIVIIIVKQYGSVDIGYDLALMIKRITLSWIFIFAGISPSYLLNIKNVDFMNVIYKLLIAVLYLFIIWRINKKAVYSFTGQEDLCMVVKLAAEKLRHRGGKKE